jgi:hypothetical protein
LDESYWKRLRRENLAPAQDAIMYKKPGRFWSNVQCDYLCGRIWAIRKH